jgi:hypothetical protein
MGSTYNSPGDFHLQPMVGTWLCNIILETLKYFDDIMNPAYLLNIALWINLHEITPTKWLAGSVERDTHLAHHQPMVVVSRRLERVPGLTGASHWVEHMLFKVRSFRSEPLIGRFLREGAMNAFTFLDWTSFFETLPPKNRPGPAHGIRPHVQLSFEPDGSTQNAQWSSQSTGSENEPLFRLSERFNQRPSGFTLITTRSW